MNKTIQEHYIRRAGGLYKGTRADQPAAGGAQRWDRQPVGWPVGPVVFLHTPVQHSLEARFYCTAVKPQFKTQLSESVLSYPG